MILYAPFAGKTISNAKAKFTMTVVMVKKILIDACFHLLYLNLNKGTALSISQKRVMPPARINARCSEEMVSKYWMIEFMKVKNSGIITLTPPSCFFLWLQDVYQPTQ